MAFRCIITRAAILISLSAPLIMFQYANAQTGNRACNIRLQQTENNVSLLTPPSDKIVFIKTSLDGERAFIMQLQAFGSEINPGKGSHIIFTNGKTIVDPDLSIAIGIPDNYRIAFKYTGKIRLTYVQMEYLKNYTVKEYSIGIYKCKLSTREQGLFLSYFNCLLKDSLPASPVTGSSTSIR